MINFDGFMRESIHASHRETDNSNEFFFSIKSIRYEFLGQVKPIFFYFKS